jgi:phosphoribosylformimino-5-aminoimidazole carboxamide ribotide isomerase
MDILPSIDLRGGRVVRLQRGDYNLQTTYSDAPDAVAAAFASAGATWIHVVDLDAALTGQSGNLPALRLIRKAAGLDVKIEFGGGARTDAYIQSVLDEGVDRVVVGSAALKNWKWFEGMLGRPELAGRLALGLDARKGKLAVDGWTHQVEATAVEVAAAVKGMPLGAIVYTDIGRDGMLTGVNVQATAEIIAASSQAVIASGGVASYEDIRLCREAGCAGVIIGKAYYEGRIDIAQAIELAGK